MRTLQDARDASLVLVAVCHNVPCRHGQLIDLESVIHHVGGAHSLLPVRGKVHFSERMRCPVCKHRGKFIWSEVPKKPEPILDGLSYAVNQWDQSSDALVSILAKARHVSVAHAAFDASLSAYPRRRITLQQGGFVLKDSRMRVIKGGKS